MAAAAAGLEEALESLASGAEPDELGRATRFEAEVALGFLASSEEDPSWAALLAEIRGEERRSWSVWELANAYLMGGRLERAEVLARFGLASGRAARTIEPRLWHVRAEAARLGGRWDEAEGFLERMERSILAHSAYSGPTQTRLLAQNHEYRARLLLARGQVWLELGLLDRLRELSADALVEARAAGEASVELAVRLFALDQAFMRGDAEEAIELARAGAAEERLANGRARFLLAEGMAEVERARDELGRASDAEPAATRARGALAAALEAGLDPAARLKAALASSDLELALGHTHSAGTALRQAEELLTAIGPAGAPAAESAQLAMLGWQLARARGASREELTPFRAELFRAYRALLEQWDSTPRRPGGIGFLHLAWRSQLVSEVLEAELDASPGPAGVARAFERVLEAQARGSVARENGVGELTLAEVRAELLALGRGMLVLLPARDRAHLFVLDPEHLEHHRIARARDFLRDEAGRITASLARPDDALDPAALRALHDQLLPREARARLAGWTGAWTVGFELLRDLPFGILGAEEGRTWGERLALSSLPSAALGVSLARRTRAPSAPESARVELVLVVASDPPPDSGLPSFSFGARERARLAVPFDPARVRVLEGGQAGRAELLGRRELLASAHVVHFLTHGTQRAGHEFATALVLSSQAPESERQLAAEDIARLSFDGLVILSACGSGRSPMRTGDDRSAGLGPVFLAAGARCVIQARFPIEYEATLELMERLHARLARGDAPAEALRAARADGAGGKSLQAFHAAAFEVLGQGFDRAW